MPSLDTSRSCRIRDKGIPQQTETVPEEEFRGILGCKGRHLDHREPLLGLAALVLPEIPDLNASHAAAVLCLNHSRGRLGPKHFGVLALALLLPSIFSLTDPGSSRGRDS